MPIPVKDREYRETVLSADDDLAPRFVTNVALHNLWKAVQKITGDPGFETMLQNSGLVELSGYFPEPDESPAINYTRFSAFVEAMEEFYGSAVEAMQIKGRQRNVQAGTRQQRQASHHEGHLLQADVG